jgi:hypothetical protein
MRFGNSRVVKLAIASTCALVAWLVLGVENSASAQPFHTIPTLTQAVDLNTGQPYYAPPVPYGHYAGKNLGGRLSGKVHGLLGGHGCGGLLHHGDGSRCNGNDGCGGGGCGIGGGGGHCGLFKGRGLGCGLCGGKGCGSCLGHASKVMPCAQAPAPSPQTICETPGCGLFGKHSRCGKGDPCGGCGGRGCGLCGGKGRLCGGCGGAGCGLCGGGLGDACAKAKGMVHHLLGHDKIEWFVGPGGPVPLTPGYTPYVIATRSPRDYFAFPPRTE